MFAELRLKSFVNNPVHDRAIFAINPAINSTREEHCFCALLKDNLALPIFLHQPFIQDCTGLKQFGRVVSIWAIASAFV